MLGLRVSEACGTDITDLRYEAGYELLHVLGKGAKPADIPLPIPVLRAVREAVDGRTAGPILRIRTGRRMDRAGATRALSRVARAAGITRPISPHGLRRTFCTTGLVAGISIRRHAVRDAPRRPAHHHPLRHGQSQPRPARRRRLAAYLAGMSTG
jgi:integrase